MTNYEKYKDKLSRILSENIRFFEGEPCCCSELMCPDYYQNGLDESMCDLARKDCT